MSNKSVVFIIAQRDFQDKELLVPKQILTQRGILTSVASKTKEPAWGKLGGEIKPDLALNEVSAKDFAGIVFVGGPGARDYFADPAALNLAREFMAAKKIIGAICAGPGILANAGILIGKTVTGFPTLEENLKSRGAFYTGMQTEVDGNIVTAKDPSAAQEFGEKLAWLLEE